MPFDELFEKLSHSRIGVEISHDKAFKRLCEELANKGVIVWDGTRDIEEFTLRGENREYDVMSFSEYHPGEKKLDLWLKRGWQNLGRPLIKANQIKFASDVTLDEFKSLIGE